MYDSEVYEGRISGGVPIMIIDVNSSLEGVRREQGTVQPPRGESPNWEFDGSREVAISRISDFNVQLQ